MKVKCNHCKKEDSFNVSINYIGYSLIDEEIYCDECVDKIVLYFVSHANL